MKALNYLEMVSPFKLSLLLYVCSFQWFICILSVLPTEAELDLIREQLFGDLDDDDGLDRVLTRLHSLRGIYSLTIRWNIYPTVY